MLGNIACEKLLDMLRSHVAECPECQQKLGALFVSLPILRTFLPKDTQKTLEALGHGKTAENQRQ